jgi:hypothetical protein
MRREMIRVYHGGYNITSGLVLYFAVVSTAYDLQYTTQSGIGMSWEFLWEKSQSGEVSSIRKEINCSI